MVVVLEGVEVVVGVAEKGVVAEVVEVAFEIVEEVDLVAL